MGHVSLCSYASGALTDSPNTDYWEPLGCVIRLYATNEAGLQTPTRTTGTWSMLTAQWSLSAGTITMENRIAGSNGAMSISPSGSGYFQDTVNTDSPTTGQLLNYMWHTGASATPPQTISSTYAGGSMTLPVCWSALSESGTAFQVNSNTTIYFPIAVFTTTSSGTDGNGGCKFQIAGTAKNFFTYMQTMASNVNITLTMRKNSTTDLAVAISVTASTTGGFEDTTHTDSIAASDLVYVKKSGGQSGSGNLLSCMSFWLDYTSGTTSDVIGGSFDSGGGTYSGTTANRFVNLQGAAQNSGSTETTLGLKIGFNNTWSNLLWNVKTNSCTQIVTVSSRITGVTKNQSISTTASTTGEFTDAVNTDAVTAGDKLNPLFVGAATISGSIVFTYITSRFLDNSTVTYNDSVSEALSLTETNSATADFHSGISRSEALSLTETNHADLNDNVSNSNALALAETNVAHIDYVVSCSESLGLTETNAGTKIAEDSHYAVIIWHSQIG